VAMASAVDANGKLSAVAKSTGDSVRFLRYGTFASIERNQGREQSGVGRLNFAVTQDGEVLLLTGRADGGFWTSLYREVNGRWIWRADKGNAPADCLYLHDTDVAQGRREALSAGILGDFASKGLALDKLRCRYK